MLMFDLSSIVLFQTFDRYPRYVIQGFLNKTVNVSSQQLSSDHFFHLMKLNTFW